MPATDAPQDLLARVRRDVERSRLRARNGLKLLSGTGAPTLGASPKDVVWSSGKVELWRYRSDTRSIRPPLFFVHSLVSRSYVFDLNPGNSFVEFMLQRGFDVFLVNWGVPDELEADNDLSTYSDELLPALVREVCRIAAADEVTMFGYCFGGVRSLAVMATPIDFSQMGPMTGIIQAGRVDPESMLDRTGNVPADVMRNSFRLLQPTGDVTGYVNLWQNLWNDDFVSAHQAMTGWANDHIPFPGAAFCEMSGIFARENLLKSGTLPIGGRTISLADIRMPFLSVLGEKDHIVTPEAASGLCDLVGSADKEELRLPAGHVGLIVGRTAHKRNLPAMADWLERHSE
jgi:polyhydroxyalkanoate synthase